MKNGKVKVFALVSALLLAVCAFAVAACDFTFRTKELTKIEVDSSSVQKVYHPGDDFDENAVKRALVVTAYYDDDTHAKINSSGFRVVPVNIDHLTTEETQTAGRDTVKVVYGEHESSYDVTITEVTSLRVDAGGLDVSFRQDESHTSGEIDHDGLKVYMVYNDGSEELLPADKYTVTADLSKAGNAKATVTTTEEVPVFERGEKDVITGGVVYKQFTAEYDINVIAHNLTKIKFKIDDNEVVKNYFVGDPFDPKGIQVVGIYEGEGEKPIELSSVKFIADGLEGGVFTKDGEITVTATFGTFTTENSFTVTVDKIRVESISFNSEKSNLNNLKTDYYDDETFSAAGLVIDVVYNDARKNKSVEYDSEKNGLKVNAPTMSEGKPQVTVTYTDDYGNATTTYDINVKAVKITGMSVKGIKSFFVGDKFDPTGITATITYNKASLNADVANVPISDNRLTAAANNLDENGMLKVGSTVTVTFDDGKHTESVTENITVTPIAINEEGTSLTVPEKEGGYFVGDEFDITAIKLHVVYNHGDPKDVNGGDAGVEVTVKGLVDGKLTESGEISISVTYTDDNKLTVTKKATITVTQIAITKIDVDTSSVKKEGYFVGDTFDPADLKATVKYNNSEKPVEVTYPDVRLTVNFTEPVNGILTVAGENISVTVKVTFKDDANRTTSKDVTIENVKVTPIKIDSVTVNATALDGKTFARDGSDYDFTGLTFSVKYNNKAEAETVDFATAKKNGTTFTASDEISAKNTRTITVNFKDANGLEYKPETPLTFTITVEAEKPKKSVDSVAGAVLEGELFFLVVNTTGYDEATIKSEFKLHFGDTPADAVGITPTADVPGQFKLHFNRFVDLGGSEEGTKYVITAYLRDGETETPLGLKLTDGAITDKSFTYNKKVFSLSVEDDNLVLTITTEKVVIQKEVLGFHNAVLEGGLNFNFYFKTKGYEKGDFTNPADVVLIIDTQEFSNTTADGEYFTHEEGEGSGVWFHHVVFNIGSFKTVGEHQLKIKILGDTYEIPTFAPQVTANFDGNTYATVDKAGKAYLNIEAGVKYKVTLDVKGGEFGSYTLKSGETDVHSGDTVKEGAALDLTVKPNEKYIANVSTNPVEALSPVAEESNKYTVTVSRDTTITIVFVEDKPVENIEISLDNLVKTYDAHYAEFNLSAEDYAHLQSYASYVTVNGTREPDWGYAGFELLGNTTLMNISLHDATLAEYNFIWYNIKGEPVANATYKNKEYVDDGSTPIAPVNNEADSVSISGWSYYRVGDTVSVAKYFAEEDKAVITFNNTGKDWWAVQLYYNTDTVTRGKTYEISLKLNSTKAGDILFYADTDNVIKTLVEGDNDIKFTFVIPTDAATRAIFRINMGVPNTPFGEATFTITNLEFTEAKPVADGTQEHPFSVDDVLAIGEKLGNKEYYKVDGVATQIYIKGVVSAVGDLNGEHGLKNVKIKPFTDSVAAAIASEVELLVYHINWGGAFKRPADGSNPLKVGDIIVVYGYLQNYYDSNSKTSTLEVTYIGDTHPTLFTWENSDDDKEVDDWLAEIEKNLTPDGGLTADYTAPNPVRPKTVTVELVITDGDTYAEVLDKTTLHIKEYPAEGSYTVKVTVKVTVGEKTSERSVTVTINPQVKTETVVVEYVFTNLTEQNAKMDLEKFKKANTTPKNEFLTAATFDNAVDGNSSGGDYYGKEKGINLIKIGSNNNSGKIELTFSENVIQVVLNCATWQKSQTNKIQVNAVSKDLPQTKGKLTFDIAETKTVTISTAKSNRGFIFSMEFTFNKTPLTTAQKKAQVQEVIDSLNVADTMSKSEPLPTTDNVDVKLSWRSDNADVIDVSDGVNFNVSQTDKEEKVTVTVTGIYNDEEATKIEKTFTITIPAKGSEPEVQTWKLVTQESQLSEGAQVVFTSGSKYCTSTGSGRFSEGKETFKLSADKNTITTLPSDIAIWTVGGAANGWTFYIKGGYLSQKGTTAKTSMELAKTVTSNSQWTLHSASNNAWGIKSNAYSSGSQYFSYNSQGGYFAAYTYQNISIYVLA